MSGTGGGATGAGGSGGATGSGGGGTGGGNVSPACTLPMGTPSETLNQAGGALTGIDFQGGGAGSFVIIGE